MGMGCDCNGMVRIFNGPYPGNMNDLMVWKSSDYALHASYYYTTADKTLGDGAFPSDPRFICPVGYLQRPLTVTEQRFNWIQNWSRSIIEHYNGRLKLTCPVVNDLKFKLSNAATILVLCICLTNIRIQYKPLRN